MTAKIPAKASTPNVPAVFTEDEFTAALRDSGFLPKSAGGSDFNRLVVKGTNIYSGDDIIAAYNQKTKEPALIVQLVGEPKQYQALWFSKSDDKDPQSNGGLAMAIDRPSIAGKFCKSHFDDPKENRRYAEDGSSCDECPVHPFVPRDQLPPEAKGKKCSWKADVDFRILEKTDDGVFAIADETIYTMSLSTTAVIEFFGSASKKKGDGMAGSVSPANTMVQIARLGMHLWGREGILKAKTMLALGGVICALHILPAHNEDKSRSWNVPSFVPLDIIEIAEQPALTTAQSDDVSTDDIPF